MQLKPEGSPGTVSLFMSKVEWKDVHALAKFAQAAIAYDAEAPYAAQVFLYESSQPRDILGNRNTQAAFKAIDCVSAEVLVSTATAGVTLQLEKEQMRQLLVMLGKASWSEDQAELVQYAEPEKFPHTFPDIDISISHYAGAFWNLLVALDEDRSLTIDRPEF